MDHMMPEMDGIEATARIREINSAVPIIALTANAMIGSKEMLVKAGMNDLLAKPIVIDEMYSVLRKWLPAKKIISKQNPTSENPIIIDDLLSFMEKGGRIITAAMNIPELDVNAGLSAAAFREDVYESSLKLLFSKIPKITDTLKICLDENNIPEFILHVQEMKSSLSAVGASSLSNQAAALEGAGSEGDSESCKKMFPEFAASLKMLKEQIALFFTGDAPVPKKTGTQAILNKNIAVLTEALENYNYDLLIETITSMAEFNFGFEINSDILKIKILADNFDYDGIIEALGEIRDLR
jgi:YesN/AraC family two-component response regulator